MSQHKVPVVKLPAPKKHPGADSLEIFQMAGYEVVSKIGIWQEGDLAAFVEDDYVVPNDPSRYGYLGKDGVLRDKDRRVRPRKLRNVWSNGILTDPPPGAKEGDDVMDALRVTRYEPPPGPIHMKGQTPEAPAPPGIYPVYDVEPLRKYKDLIPSGMPVCVFEKIHGCSTRYVRAGDTPHCGSHKRWKQRSTEDPLF